MENITSICLRVDADEKLGLGHLSRCRSLMLAFSSLAECNFSVVSNKKDIVKKFIPNINFNLFDVDNPFEGQHFDLAIVDVPNIANKKRHFQGFADLIACIDDEGQGVNCQDIFIRPNLLNLPKPSKILSENYWSGSDYIILHPDFVHQAQQKKVRSGEVKEMLVCFGGSDLCGLTLRAIPLLKKLDNEINIHLVLGAAFQWRKEVLSALENKSCFKVTHNISNMAHALWNSDVALISGGTLLYEACSLGTPSVVIPQNKSQDVEASICHDAGAVINLGVNEAVSDDKILVALQQIIKDASLRANMESKGKEVIPSDGTMRIASKLLTLAKKDIL